MCYTIINVYFFRLAEAKQAKVFLPEEPFLHGYVSFFLSVLKVNKEHFWTGDLIFFVVA